MHARWVIPVGGDDDVLPRHSVAVHEDRIVDILPTDSITQHYSASNSIDYASHALIPGLINSHTHAAMSLFRGLADDLSLMDWLQNHIWPAETQHVNEAFVKTGTELALAEMIRSGTTCMNDMYFFPDVAARVCKQAGFRASIGLIVLDFPTIWARDADEYIDKGLALRDQYREDPLIMTAFAPHAPYTVSDQPLEKVRMFSHELDMPIHMHVHETAHEVEEAVAKTGRRPLARLHELGLLSPAMMAVHMTQLEQREIELLTETGVNVIHCPESNLKLASGFCPVTELLTNDINVAIGTDSAASNNDMDMFGEMRTTALLAKGVAADATAVPAMRALQMATLGAARALGKEDSLGSLSPGKQADIVAVDFDAIETAPVFDPVSHLVYCCGREQVSDVWIAGKQVLHKRELLTLDESSIKHNAIELSNSIS